MNRRLISDFHSALNAGPKLSSELANKKGFEHIDLNIIVVDKKKKRSRPNKSCFIKKKNPNKTNIIIKANFSNIFFLKDCASKLRNITYDIYTNNMDYEFPVKNYPNVFYSVLIGPKAVTYEQLVDYEIPKTPQEEENYLIAVYYKHINEFVKTIPNKYVMQAAVFNRLFKMWSKYHGFYPNLTSKHYKIALNRCGVKSTGKLRGGKKMYIIPKI